MKLIAPQFKISLIIFSLFFAVSLKAQSTYIVKSEDFATDEAGIKASDEAEKNTYQFIFRQGYTTAQALTPTLRKAIEFYRDNTKVVYLKHNPNVLIKILPKSDILNGAPQIDDYIYMSENDFDSIKN